MLLVVAIWIDKSKHAKLNQLWPPNKKVQKGRLNYFWNHMKIDFPNYQNIIHIFWEIIT
jgi:hypothetical protein